MVWVGFDDNRELNLEGAKSALPIWAEFMKRAAAMRQYKDAKPFAQPSGIVSAKICMDSGQLAGDSCPRKLVEQFIDGTQPVQQCPLHSMPVSTADRVIDPATAPTTSRATAPAASAPKTIPPEASRFACLTPAGHRAVSRSATHRTSRAGITCYRGAEKAGRRISAVIRVCHFERTARHFYAIIARTLAKRVTIFTAFVAATTGAPSRRRRRFSVTIPLVRIGLVLILAASQIRAAADMPMTLVSENEAEPIHGAILRKEAWTQDAVRRLRADADKRMPQGPWSVTAVRPKEYRAGCARLLQRGDLLLA